MSLPEPKDNHPMHLGLYIAGGLMLGAGILNLYWSFGWDPANNGERAALNSGMAGVGFSALDNISLLPRADFSIPLVVMGLCMLIIANATAWKETGGY